MRRAALIAASMIVASGAAAVPLDPTLLEVLASRGYIVMQGSPGQRRLAAVHWKALEALAAAAASCRFLSAPAEEGPDSGLDACRELPADGAMTPRLHRLASALTAAHEERWALKLSSSAITEPEGLPNLFETPWGREWALRRRADRAEDPTPFVKGFFEERLAGPSPDEDAVKHFLAVTTASGFSGAQAKLAEDASHGAASDELRSWIRRYLLDERRRRGLTRAQDRITTLRAEKQTLRDLEGLDSLTTALTARPGLLASLETAQSATASPTPGPRLLSAGIHLQESTHLGQHELGDEASVSGAYWVDGLPEGTSTEVEETSFRETARGFSSVETLRVKRRNGGPYPFTRRIRIDETHPFAFRAVISAPSGATVSERAEVPVGPDYQLALAKEAEAQALSLSCDPRAAEASYAGLEALVVEAAKVKPQYKELLERARKARAKTSEDAAVLARLEEAHAASRPDASPQQCRYDTARTDAAIKIARSLPAGCDRVLTELFAQRAAISRRASDQSWFLKASDEARASRRSCDLDKAALRWSQALSVLESDPAARCGHVAEQAQRAELELSEVQTSIAWTEQLEKSLAKAESEKVPAKKLESVHPARARLAFLPDRACRKDELDRAAEIADRAGLSEGGPTDAEVSRLLPRETLLASAVEEVRRSRARLLVKSDGAALPAAIPAPPKKVKVKAKPAAAKKKTPTKKKATP